MYLLLPLTYMQLDQLFPEEFYEAEVSNVRHLSKAEINVTCSEKRDHLGYFTKIEF